MTRCGAFAALAGGGKPAIVCAIALTFLAGCDAAGGLVERRLNTLQDERHRPVSPTAADRDFHARFLVADLHADTLLWRDPRTPVSRGHADLPRLLAGNVALQAFTVATNSPIAPGDCVADIGLNWIGILQAVQGRPLATWFDLEARARYQATLLIEAAARDERLTVIRTLDDLRTVIERRRRGEVVVGGLLGLEGIHWVGGDDDQVRRGVRRLYAAGFRMLALSHRFDNGLAGASEGCARGGLTRAGRVALAEARRLGMIIDLAHLSSAALQQAVATLPATGEPPLMSHGGARGSCPEEDGCNPRRNLYDRDIVAIARAGGVIAVGFWPEAVGSGVERVVDTMLYIEKLLERNGFRNGFAHVALGSDYDGTVEVPFPADELAVLTRALRARGVGDDDIAKILGLNACRVIATRLGAAAAEARRLCRPDRLPPPT